MTRQQVSVTGSLASLLISASIIFELSTGWQIALRSAGIGLVIGMLVQWFFARRQEDSPASNPQLN